MQLKKELNGIEVFSIAAGSMISSGLFVLPAVAYTIAGSGILFAYIIAGFLMLPSLFSILELATAMPKAGGAYFFTERILGRAPGVINGFANWFSICLKSAFALIGIGAFASLIYPAINEFEMKAISLFFCLLFTCVNLYSIKSSGFVQTILVIFLIIILFAFILVGYRVMNFQSLYMSLNFDWQKIILVTGMVFVSYGGLTKIASIAEEIKNPQKNLIRGGISAYLIVQSLYVLSIVVLLGLLNETQFSKTLTPISDAGFSISPRTWVGRTFQIMTAVGAMLAFITTANAGIMTASRVPMSMSRDGLLPPFFSKLSKKKKIPYISILITSVFMIISIVLLDIEGLAKIASLFMLFLFIMVNLSLIIIRKSKLSHFKPSFKSPFFPYIQVIGILIYTFLIIKMGILTISVACVFVISALIWYFVYAREKIGRKSAFIHMVENMSDPQMEVNESEIETELLDILIERDEIVEDRFDKIIRRCIALDIEYTISRSELFRLLSDCIADRWNFNADRIEIKLNEREDLATTLIYPGIAVPHVITEGENVFDIILIRNKYGIIWNKNGDVVYTAFFLIGSKDERHFHLRSLMFIAQILQDADFQKEWAQAKNEKELKSTILLTKRKRK